MKRTVTADLALDVSEPAQLVLAIAVAEREHSPDESLAITTDAGTEIPVEVVHDAHGGRLHRLAAPTGRLTVAYRATVTGTEPPASVSDVERIRYVRPSRYAESDALAAFATAEFAGVNGAEDRGIAVSSWVRTHVDYVSGSSRTTDGAVQTLLSRQGVCRDYSHLCVALLRALGVPARLVAVYAPGLDPMDFHAVAEFAAGDAWRVVDATALAPRPSLVRIATGRDAADTAFLTVLSGRARLAEMTVSAVADDLPADDLDVLVSLQ